MNCRFIVCMVFFIVLVFRDASIDAGEVLSGGKPSDDVLPVWDTFCDTWVAVDGLGRTIAENKDVGNPKAGRFVGVFYYVWHGTQKHNGRRTGPYDITKILAENSEAPKWGSFGAFHHWGEPLFGYYLSDDEFVIRRHCQMLVDAGVDVIVLDVTNGLIYQDEFLNLCRIFTEIRERGGRTPQIAFLLNSRAGQTADALYECFYSKKLYSDLWFSWKGKPLMLVKPSEIRQELRDFFTTRQSWAWTKGHDWFGDGKDKWPWLDFYPQNFGWHEIPEKPEQLTVSAAQHPVSNVGRSYHNGKQPPPELCRTGEGLYFAEQWKRVGEVNPEFVFITQWNEWTAQRFNNRGGVSLMGRPLQVGETYFVDEYSQEFSRDIEPMKGGHGDNYYWQMVDGIRRYKGVRSVPVASAPVSISFTNGFMGWKDVAPEYRDDIGDVFHRNHQGVGLSGVYTVQAGRNDFKLAKVARDSTSIWFYVQTVGAITPPQGVNWMNLLISVDGSKLPVWETFQYMIGLTDGKPEELVLKVCEGGWKWTIAGKVEYLLKGNELMIGVPRRLLGMDEGETAVKINFKWSDNMQSPDPIDWLINGDTAPNARFQYRYVAQ